jgi:hypothetical protein
MAYCRNLIINTAVLRIRDVLSRIPDPDPTFAPSRIQGVKKHRIPDPGGKKAPDPGSGSATLQYRKSF